MSRKRNITDEEISLIKAMLKLKIPNDKIHFYFNRADRLVSSGRITQIKQGKYGSGVIEADRAAVEAFITEWDKRRRLDGAGNTRSSPINHDVIRSLFESRGKKGWFLVAGETDRAECKANFCLKPQERFADSLRSIAGLANNKGGYLFFGVRDKTYEVIGLRDDVFKRVDSAEISRVITTALDPVPRYDIACLEFDGKIIGVIHVSACDHPPVVATKGFNKDLVEGTIYYRYVGESKAIKPGELRQIIAHREQQAVGKFVQNMTRVADGSVATLDLDNGKISGRSDAFLIGKELLPEIQFIREGKFSEPKDAPTLRLIGEVRPAAEDHSPMTSMVRKNITDDAVIRNFLQKSPVTYPINYLQRSCHTQRRWLPIFYYMKMAGLSVEQTLAIFDAEDPSYPKICRNTVDRINGTVSAFQKTSGAAAKMLALLEGGAIPDPKDAKEAATIARAIGGLNGSGSINTGYLNILENCLTFSKGSASGSLRSQIYRAACRLDELMFKPVSTIAST